jgi:hypothetical protein
VARTGTGGFPHAVDEDGDLWARLGAEIRSSFLFVDGETGATQRTGYGEMTEQRLRDLTGGLANGATPADQSSLPNRGGVSAPFGVSSGHPLRETPTRL